MKNFHLCALGCPRRGIDSQKIYDYLQANGWSFTEDYRDANLIVVSTCAFVKDREDQSLQAIDYYRENLEDHAKIVVAGCLSEINPDSIAAYDDIDFLSPRELNKFDRIIEADIKFENIPDPNQIFSHPFAPDLASQEAQKGKQRLNIRLDSEYEKENVFTVRLARGCLGNCSYCAIKFAAGSLESKQLIEIIKEFKKGLNQEYQRFTLVAGDTGCYGIDIGTTIVDLLSEIFKIEGAYKLILKEFNAQWLIKYQLQLENLLKNNDDKIDYIIVPVQSASDRILQLMKRPYKIERVKECLRSIQEKIPNLKITTHIMAGFPGETEEDFQKSLDFIKEFKFPFVDIYGYEDRPRTQASHLEGKIPQNIIDQRVKQLRTAQEEILSAERHAT
ncbi:MAG: MiaB/RimO family radical SAM methylthiotransferase [Desulfobacterales bacterium]|jgi:MiaB/RimO family radical SAM methylthiotransferase